MDRARIYTYTLGSGEELRVGKLEDLETSENPKSLARKLKKRSKLVLPRFIGVYQEYKVIPHGGSEAAHIDTAQSALDGLAGLINSASALSILEKTGVLDRTHPNLVHIGYDGDLWTEDLVRLSVSDELRRIAISTIQEIPNFYNKDETPFANIARNGQQFNTAANPKETKKLFERDIKEARDQRDLYGLTLMEYSLLKVAQQMHEGPSRIQHPLEFFKGLMGAIGL